VSTPNVWLVCRYCRSALRLRSSSNMFLSWANWLDCDTHRSSWLCWLRSHAGDRGLHRSWLCRRFGYLRCSKSLYLHLKSWMKNHQPWAWKLIGPKPRFRLPNMKPSTVSIVNNQVDVVISSSLNLSEKHEISSKSLTMQTRQSDIIAYLQLP